MRTTSAALLSAFLALPFALTFAGLPGQAQTTAKPAPNGHSAAIHTTHSTAAHSAPGGCVKLPDISPKVPALPAGAPCAKALYTLTAVPDIRVDYTSPVEGDLAQTLGLEPVSFTLAYVDTKIGQGDPALPHKYYTVKYTGYLVDGAKFDSSEDHPEKTFTFQVGGHQVVAGWDTGFAGMKIGGKRRLYIPFQLAYGPNGRPPTIPARAELIFDMELISQSDSAPAPKAPPTPPAAAAPKPASPGATPPAATPPTPPPAPAAPAAPPAGTAPKAQ